MRGKITKVLRKEARIEMAMNQAPVRKLAQRQSGSVVNEPISVRAMFLQLKKAYAAMRRTAGTPTAPAVRNRKPHVHTGAQPEDRIARIAKPLMLILEHCPPQVVTDTLTGAPKRDPFGSGFLYEPHPVYKSARIAADRGRGDLVNKMAAQFLPA